MTTNTHISSMAVCFHGDLFVFLHLKTKSESFDVCLHTQSSSGLHVWSGVRSWLHPLPLCCNDSTRGDSEVGEPSESSHVSQECLSGLSNVHKTTSICVCTGNLCFDWHQKSFVLTALMECHNWPTRFLCLPALPDFLIAVSIVPQHCKDGIVSFTVFKAMSCPLDVK